MEIKIEVKDLLWLLTLGPSLKEVSDQPRYLKLCALAYHGYEFIEKEPAKPYEVYNFGSIGPEWRLMLSKNTPSKVSSYYPNKVGAIKYLRQFTGMGLKEAKDAVEQGISIPTSMCQTHPSGGFHSWTEAVKQFASMGYTVERYDNIHDQWMPLFVEKPLFSDTPVPGGTSLGELLKDYGEKVSTPEPTVVHLSHSGVDYALPDFDEAVKSYVKDKKAEK